MGLPHPSQKYAPPLWAEPQFVQSMYYLTEIDPHPYRKTAEDGEGFELEEEVEVEVEVEEDEGDDYE